MIVAVLVVLATVIGIILAPWAARIPLTGIGLNLMVRVASVVTMVEPPPVAGG